MKKTIENLPQETQREIDTLTELITEHVSDCRMIILFGCYSCGHYVIREERFNSELPEVYRSDYDLLVVTEGTDIRNTERILRGNVLERYLSVFGNKADVTPVEFMVEDIDNLKRLLEKGEYFHTSVIKDGITLYNPNNIEPPKLREWSFREIRDRAEKYYNLLFEDACKYTGDVATLDKACRQFYKTIFSVFTLFNTEENSLLRLNGMVKRYSRELNYIFPRRTEFETRCFDLLDRTDGDLSAATKEELDYLSEKTVALMELTECICQDRLAYYDEMEK